MEQNTLSTVDGFIDEVNLKNPNEPEFLQAVKEVAHSVIPYLQEHPKYQNTNIFYRMVEPERVVMFRVPWLDDRGTVQVNRGFRIQFNSAIGPYKGGLRFHPTVNLSILKFLGFEQIFKNALTTLPMGGAKGGADFDPKGKSDNEVMRFCQSFMTELYRHIGEDTDVPAGDIGVGPREIGYLFGQYKRLQNQFTGVMTGKGLSWGGSHIRPEATGYGTVYFVQQMLEHKNDNLEGKTVAISGSGNVSIYATEKAMQVGGRVVTLSDSSGYIMVPSGINDEQLAYLKELKFDRQGRLWEAAEAFSEVEYFDKDCVWYLPMNVDVVLPCATQNELEEAHARHLISKGAKLVAEGANMPCTMEAVELFESNNVLFGPGKAANAGGVATSGLEMSQNAAGYPWKRKKVEKRLFNIMNEIHRECKEYGEREDGTIDYVKGANLAGFIKVADAMLDQGAV